MRDSITSGQVALGTDLLEFISADDAVLEKRHNGGARHGFILRTSVFTIIIRIKVLEPGSLLFEVLDLCNLTTVLGIALLDISSLCHQTSATATELVGVLLDSNHVHASTVESNDFGATAGADDEHQVTRGAEHLTKVGRNPRVFLSDVDGIAARHGEAAGHGVRVDHVVAHGRVGVSEREIDVVPAVLVANEDEVNREDELVSPFEVLVGLVHVDGVDMLVPMVHHSLAHSASIGVVAVERQNVVNGLVDHR